MPNASTELREQIQTHTSVTHSSKIKRVSRRRHTAEGPDDMTSHIRTALTNTQLGIPVHAGQLALGTWQGIYLFEHRRVPHRRSIVLHLLAE